MYAIKKPLYLSVSAIILCGGANNVLAYDVSLENHTPHISLSDSAPSYQIARMQFLPDIYDDLGMSGRSFKSGYYKPDDKCKDYPLTICPDNGVCISCISNSNKKKLTGCKSGYKISENGCVASNCSAIDSSYKSSVPSNSVCTKVSQQELTCYSNCRNIQCGSYPIDCPSGMTGDNYTTNGITYQSCPDCPASQSSSSTTVYSCVTRKCKITSCPSTQKLNSTESACIDKDDSCPTNYYKSCETGIQGDPEYTELGTACYQCKIKQPETCAKYVEDNFSDYTRITSLSDLQHALIDGLDDLVIVNDFTINADVDLSGKTVIGANEIAGASSLCANTPKITVQGKTQIKTNDTSEFTKLNFINKIETKDDCYWSEMISGGGTFRDIEFTFIPEKQVSSSGSEYYNNNWNTPHMAVKGTANFYNVRSTGMKHFTVEDSSTLNIKGKLDVTKSDTDTSISGDVIAISGNNPIVNIENGATLTYHGASDLFSANDGVGNCQLSNNPSKTANNGILNINGSVTHTIPETQYAPYTLDWGGNTVNINTPTTFIGRLSASAININAETTINARNSLWAIYGGLSGNSEVNINAPLKVINAKAFDQDLDYNYANDGAFEADNIYINSDVIFDNKVEFIKLIGPDTLTFGPKANVKGLARWFVSSKGYSALKTISYSSGAQIEIGGVCKKATTSGSITPDTKTTIIWKTPQSPFTGTCSSSIGGGGSLPPPVGCTGSLHTMVCNGITYCCPNDITSCAQMTSSTYKCMMASTQVQ